ETLELVRERAVADATEGVRAGAIEALAEHWGELSEVLQFLVDQAKNEPASSCRRVIVHEAGGGWPSEPQVFQLLRDRAVNDSDELVRQVAVQMLGEHWRETPETREILIDRLQNDSDMMPRLFAIIRVIQWKGDPDVRDLFRSLAAADTESIIRSLSMLWLAESVDDKEEPEIATLARERAVNDADVIARDAALNLALRLTGDISENQALLRDRVMNDLHPPIRATALERLVGHTSGDPEMENLVRERSIEDPDDDVRKRALGLLVREWGDRSDVVAFLKRRAVDDPSPAVRLASFQLYTFLAEEAPDNDTIRHVLVNSDDSSRSSAALGLAFTYSREGRLADVFRSLSCSDGDAKAQKAVEAALSVMASVSLLA
ncbi:HEAT repeat domain-containing protein, partial [Streptomyces rochei]